MASSAPSLPEGVRLAATVVVMRGDAPAPEIFMVRRSARSPFMPDTFVFPGGRLDADDGDPHHAERGHEAFERAARRETREEASIDLTDRPLRWFDTWLTPSGEGRRYLARFYLARLGGDEGHDAVHDGHETTEGFWSPVRGILDLWRNDRVDLPPPTLSVLLNLADPRWSEVIEREAAELSTPILPKVSAAGSALHIVMPHDPEYAGIDGEGLAAPPRSHTLPTRFVREPKRWRPL